MHTCEEKMALKRKSQFFSELFEQPHETSNLEKVMGWCTAQWKCCCFVHLRYPYI